MRIRFGYELKLHCAADTVAVAMLSVHPTERGRLETVDSMRVAPDLPTSAYADAFGNVCTRFVVPAGIETTLLADAVIRDSGAPDRVAPTAGPADLARVPNDVLTFLVPSRYCDSDVIADLAWRRFGAVAPGWARVQAICDFVHDRLTFGYEHARPTRTAAQALGEEKGVCRDFAHSAISLCRAMNIPARYCTGYLGDIGIAPLPSPMDFSAWFEAYLDGGWYTFDARFNTPRIGRIVVARGRDAADVAMLTTFGPHALTGFRVWTDELPAMADTDQPLKAAAE